MGDHRASIRVRFEMHGEVSETDMWINWYVGAWNDQPTMLLNFFRDAEEKSMRRFFDDEDKAVKARRVRSEAILKRVREKLSDEEWEEVRRG